MVSILASVSTVIDVAMQRPTPTPFGTQHVALLLAAWGPAMVFGESDQILSKFLTEVGSGAGHIPSVRRALARKLTSSIS
jgi:hypothetical protein